MVKIYLGIATRRDGSWGMFQSVLNNIISLNRKKMMLAIEPHIGDSLICRARQNMTYNFLQSDATHFMQLDDDIQLPPDAIVKLVEADKPIVGGFYRLRTKERDTNEVGGIKGERYKLALRALTAFNIDEGSNELVKIKYLSTGCFLQKREVIEDMWKRYENLRYADKGEVEDRRALYMPMVHDGEYLSEDWAYCQRAEDVGYDIWLHTGVYCGHWGIYNYDFDGEE